jgi:hypothetical protein
MNQKIKKYQIWIMRKRLTPRDLVKDCYNKEPGFNFGEEW